MAAKPGARKSAKEHVGRRATTIEAEKPDRRRVTKEPAAAANNAKRPAPEGPATKRHTPRVNVTPDGLDRLRAICLALPEATEKQTWDIPTFRVRDKIFAMAHDPGTVWCKAPPGVQAILIGAAPERFFAPPYVGPKGWIGFHIDHAADWEEVTALIRRSYRMTVPKRLAALVPEEA